MGKDAGSEARNETAKMMAKIVKVIPEGERAAVTQEFISCIWGSIMSEMNTETLVLYVSAMSEMVKLCPVFLDENSVDQMAQTSFKLLGESDKRKQINDDYMKENVSLGTALDAQDEELFSSE